MSIIELLPSDAFHLPGKHSQKSHGRGARANNTNLDDFDREAATANAQALQQKASFAMSEIGGSFFPEHEEVHGAWSSYVGGGYQDINGAARGTHTGSPDTTRDIDLLDQAFESRNAGVQSSKPIITHRGVDAVHGASLQQLRPGDRVVDDGFMSTTIDATTADGFAQNGGLRFDIRVPGGQSVISGDANESELILPRGTELRYVGEQSGIMQFEVVT